MKIKIFPRSYFAQRQGSPTEIELLENNRIISLNSSGGTAGMPPFSDLRAKNLLCLTVDDIVWKIRGMVLFNKDHAAQIWEFAENSTLPILVHCHAGISRSGAVGEVLNWYFNIFLQKNPREFADFYQEHPLIVPNEHIKGVLLETLERKLGLKNGSCLNMMKQEFENLKNGTSENK